MVRRNRKAKRPTRQAVNCDVEMDLISKLPPEVWKIIAEMVLKMSRNDYKNFVNSAPYFQSLMENERTANLFEDVFPILTGLIWEKEGIEGLPISDVMICRAVCSKWKRCSEPIISDELKKGNDSKISDSVKAVSSCFEFENGNGAARSILAFLGHFEQTHANKSRDPTIWGKISVTITYPEDNEENIESIDQFIHEVETLLRSYGKHFSAFSLTVNAYQFFENALRFRNCFSCIPQIKDLKLVGTVDWFDYPEDMNLDGYGNDYGFLAFRNLQSLEICSLPKPMFNQLLLQNMQVKTLSLECWEADLENSTLALTSLSNLSLTNDVTEIVNTLDSPVPWPVKSLSVSFTNDIDGGLMIDALLAKIQNDFATSLEDLHLEIKECVDSWQPEVWESSVYFRLDLPNLKRIELTCLEYPLSLDFLLPMRLCLEKIKVRISYDFPVDHEVTGTSGTIVQFHGYECMMTDSNIWAIFKNLEEIIVAIIDGDQETTTTYYRKNWKTGHLYD